MSLHELQTNFEKNVLSDGSLDLSDATAGLPVVGLFLNQILHNSDLNVRQAQVSLQNAMLKVAGVADVLGLKGVEVVATFQESDGAVDGTLGLTVPLPDRLRTAGLSAASVCLGFSHNGATDGTIASTLHAGGTDLPISMTVHFPGSGDLWYVTGDFESSPIPIPGLPDLIKVFNDSALAGYVPAGLGDLTTGAPATGLKFGLADAGLVFNPSDRSVGLLSWRVQTPDWQITPDFLIRDVAFSLDVTDALDKAKRAIEATVKGAVMAAGVAIPVQVQGPDTDGNYTLQIVQGVGVDLPSIADLFAAFGSAQAHDALPQEIQGIQGLHLQDIEVIFNPQAHTLSSLSFTVSSTWDIIPGEFGVTDATIQLRITHPLASAQRTLDGRITGTMQIAGVNFNLSAMLADTIVLAGAEDPHTSISLSKVIQAFLPAGTPLPPEVPDVSFTNGAFSITPKTREYTLSGTEAIGWMLPFGVPQLLANTTSVNLTRGPAADGEKGGPLSCMVSVACMGPITLVPGLTFGNFNLDFEIQEQNTWVLANTLDATIFDTPVKLKTSFKDTPEALTFSLSAGDAANPFTITLGSVGSLSGSGLEIVVRRDKQGQRVLESTPQTQSLAAALPAGVLVEGVTEAAPAAAEQPQPAAADGDAVQMSKTSPYAWSVTADGSIRINSVFGGEAAGKLALHVERGSAALAFKPQTAEAAFGLPQPYEAARLYVDLAYLSLKVTREGGHSGYAFDTEIGAWFTGLSGRAAEIAPSADKPGKARFEAGDNAVTVSLEDVADLPEFAIPPIFLGKDTIDLGRTRFEVPKIAVTIAKPPSLAVELAMGIPEKANSFFGESNGQPLFKLFRTYDPQMPDSLIDFRLGLTTKGLTFECLTSPFAPGLLQQTDRPGWWLLDLGAFGAVQFQMPVFTATANTFAASGAFDIVRQLKLPLVPIKLLLEACKLPALNNLIPDAVPIEGLQIVDANGNFDFTALGQLGFPRPAQDALRQLDGRLDRLPERLRSYLHFAVPDSLSFAINVSLEGAATVDIQAPGDQPIKLLWPSLGPTGPQLMGMELRSFSIGELLSGVLMLVKADVTVDTFDLASLIAALAIPSTPLLPDPTTLTRRMIVSNLFMPIIVETVVPLPVPLFIDQFGIEYQGLEGLAFQVHAGFHPTGSPGLDTALDAYHTFHDFFTQHDTLLDANTPPGVDLVLAFGPNFIRLPKYLGGGQLGSVTDVKTISLWANLAHALNALKTLSVEEIANAIPLEDRSGQVQGKLALAAMNADAEWLVATPAELKAGAFQRIHVPEDRVNYLLALPYLAAGKESDGLLIYLHGGWHVAGVLDLDAALGLLAADGRFATGFDFSGKIGNFIDAQMRGNLVIQAPSQSAPASATPSGLTAASRDLPSAAAVPLLPGPAITPFLPGPALPPAVVAPARYAPTFRGPNDMIAMPNLNWMPDAFTVEWWVLPNSHHNWNQALSSSVGWGGFVCHTTETGAIYCGTDVVTRFTPANIPDGTVQLGVWQHFAFTYNRGTGIFYKNGVQLATRQNMTHPVAWQGFQVGGTNGNTIDGQVTDVRIWNVARAQGDIRADMFGGLTGSEPGLQAYWPLDDGTGTTATDLTGKYPGSLRGAYWAACDLNSLQGLDFNGQGDNVTMPTFDWAPQVFTVEWWINPRSHHNWTQSVHAGAGWGSFVCHTTEDGALYCGTDVNTRFTPGSLPPGILELNTWQHFAFSFDHGTGAFYKNGVRQSTKAGMMMPGRWAGFQLGAAGGNWIDGQMAEVRIWNQALPDADIQHNMFRRLAGNEPGLVACWPLAEGSGNVAHDLTPAGHDGQVQGAKWTQPHQPAAASAAAIQLNGMAFLSILGQQVFKGSVGLADGNFWLKGNLDLFPNVPGIQATGDLQGWINGQEFYISGRAGVSIYGMTLVGARAVITNGLVNLDGSWLNGRASLAVKEQSGALTVHGTASWWVDLTIDLGKVTKLIGLDTAVLANNVHIASRFSGSMDVTAADWGFTGIVTAGYTFNGKTIDLPGFSLTGGDPKFLIQSLTGFVISDAAGTVQKLFTDAGEWLTGVSQGVISWAGGTYAEIGKTLGLVYDQTMDSAIPLLSAAQYQIGQIGQVLSGFGGSAGDAAAALKRANYNAEAACQAIKAGFTQNINTAASALETAGYQANDVCASLKNNFSNDAGTVASAMKQAGYAAWQVAGSLQNFFLNTSQDIFSQANQLRGWLNAAGFGAGEIAGIIASLLHINI